MQPPALMLPSAPARPFSRDCRQYTMPSPTMIWGQPAAQGVLPHGDQGVRGTPRLPTTAPWDPQPVSVLGGLHPHPPTEGQAPERTEAAGAAKAKLSSMSSGMSSSLVST